MPGQSSAAAGDGGGGPVEAAGKGLSQAADAAGDILKDIFGGLPWNMDPSSIVDAVAPGVMALPDVVGVVL